MIVSSLYRPDSVSRQRQINTLKIFNDKVVEVVEDSEYNVLFQAGVYDFCLIVILPSDFPTEKPILKITPVVNHPWVSKDGEIKSAPGLLNFTVHSDLGRVVQAIIREFERNPPPLATDQGLKNNSPSITIRDVDNRGKVSPVNSYSGLSNFSPPIYHYTSPTSTPQSVILPELNDLTLEELKFLNESPDAQDEFLEELPQIKEMNKSIEDIILQIEELSDSNLEKKDYLENLKSEIEKKIEEVTKLAFENERLNNTYQILSEKYSPKNINEQLRQEAESADTESEIIAKKFLNGEIDVDKFINIYLSVRTLSQTRKTKQEKLTQQLQNLEKAGF